MKCDQLGGIQMDIEEKKLMELEVVLKRIRERWRTEMKCRNGHVSIPRLGIKGPHIEARCEQCDRYIKFLPQT